MAFKHYTAVAFFTGLLDPLPAARRFVATIHTIRACLSQLEARVCSNGMH